MPEISYNLINQRFIKDYKWIPQAEVIINVSGPTDPLSLQLMRDAVFHEVEPRMTKLNAMLGKITDEYDKYASGKKRKGNIPLDENAPKFVKELLTRSQTLVRKQIDDFKPAVQHAVDDFCQANARDEEKVKAFKENLTTNKVKATVNTSWGLFDVGKGVSEIVVGGAVATTGLGAAAGAVAFWKGCFDIAKGSLELWGKLSEWWAGAAGAAEALEKHLVKLKNTGTGKKVSKADVVQAEKLLDEFESYVLKAEMTGKQLSRELQVLLKKSDDCPDKKDRERFESSIQDLIDRIGSQGPVIAKFRPCHRKAETDLKELAKGNLQDTVEVVKTAKEIYSYVSPVVDTVCSLATGDFVIGPGKAALGFIIEKKT